MIFGVSGASGTGKTTICTLVADALDMTFLRTSITEVAKANGFDPVAPIPLKDRILLQDKLLEDHITKIKASPTPVILDRTPIDMIGYMMCEVHMHSGTQLCSDEMDWIVNYTEACMKVARTYYDFIFHLGALPTYEKAATRPGENPAYQRHCDLVMRGALHHMHGQMNCAFLNTTDLDERQTFVHDTIVERMNKLHAFREESRNIH